MQFKPSAFVGVLIMVYLSTDSWCLYVPPKNNSSVDKNEESGGQQAKSDQIQICGNALTTFIIEACDGIVGGIGQANSSKDSIQTKITEECCDQKCPLDYLQNYCGDTPLFTIKKTLRGELLSKFNLNSIAGSEAVTATRKLKKEKKKAPAEVRLRGNKEWGRTPRKRRRSFKWKCAYKSFAHYLLKLDRSVGARSNKAKRTNSLTKSWPSIQIGTISPEIDKFGGQPIVVVKKDKSASL